ncbi:hypothetical protein L1887_53619 [Cichorium endivia]|nr:hypothetical protein L1887_53619 [Cichorium endivia]
MVCRWPVDSHGVGLYVGFLAGLSVSVAASSVSMDGDRLARSSDCGCLQYSTLTAKSECGATGERMVLPSSVAVECKKPDMAVRRPVIPACLYLRPMDVVGWRGEAEVFRLQSGGWAQSRNSEERPGSGSKSACAAFLLALPTAARTHTHTRNMSTDLNVDIHNVPSEADVDVSSALSQPLPTTPAVARTEAMSLLALQKQLDGSMQRHLDVLAANGVTMQTPLIDAQGFPLANKDLMAIRMARQRINVLRNDSHALRDRVAKLLEDTLESSSTSSAQKKVDLDAFARFNSVADSSPAQAAGLREGDRVVKFGSVTAQHPQGLAALAAQGVVVDGTPIQLLVSRGGSSAPVEITLVPRAGWGGRGLLGCHLVPI